MAKIVLTISADNKATQSVRLLNAEVKTLSQTLSSIKVNKNLTTQINALTKHYKAVADAHAKIIVTKNKEAIADEKLRLQKQKIATEAGRTAIQLAKEKLQLEKVNTEKSKQILNEQKVQKATKVTTSQTEKLVKQYADLINTIKSLEKNYKKGTFDSITSQVKDYFNEVKGLDSQLKSGAISQEEYNNKVVQATAQLQGFKTEVASTRTEAKNFHGTLQDTVSGFLKFQLSAMLVMKPLQMMRSALSSINETLVKTEDAVIALQRVLPSGSASDSEISSRLYKIAQDYGQTFENVQQIATNFARTGMSWADTIKATEAAVLALNVAELDAEEATTGLIAILSQFGLKASDLESVIDKLNKTADNFPVTTEKILAALQRTGSAADNTNLSLDQTIALVTALSKATGRSGQNIGTALNSLIQYSSKASALDTFANLSDESRQVVENFRKGLQKADGSAYNILDVWKQVSKEIQNLKSEQADLLDGYFSTEDGQALSEALDGELEDIYTELGGVYDTANTFRKNYFIALLGNMDTVEQAMGTLDKASGYSQKENQKYLDTYTAKVNKLKAQWQDFANSAQGLLGLKKLLADLGSGVLTILKYTGGLRTILIAITPIVFSLVGAKVISGIKTIFTTLATGITTLKGLAGWIGVIATAISLIIGLVEQLKQDEREDFTNNIDKATSSLDDLAESIGKTTDKYDEYIAKTKELRAVLADGESSTDKLTQAQNSLLEIQNEVIKNNHAYKDSLDLVNGNLDEQIDKLKKISEEKARQQVEDFIRENKSGIYNAEQYLKETFSEIATGESGGLYGGLNDENFALTNFLGGTQGSEEDFWGAFGEGFKSVFGGKITGYAQLDEKKTREEIIKWLNEQYDRADREIEDENQRDKIQARISDLIAFYDNDTYKYANSLIYGDKSSTDWIERLTQEQRKLFAEKKLTLEEIYKILGIEKDTSKEIAIQTNDITKLKDNYKDIITSLKEQRDISKESTEWEEKKLAVLEAQKALEDARNQATVRRFNEATGQWEWQVDEKAVKDAEKNLQKAEQSLSDETFDRIIELFEKGIATNESIDEIAKDAGTVMGEEFVKAIRDFFQKETGVDISQAPRTETITVGKDGSYDSGGNAKLSANQEKIADLKKQISDLSLVGVSLDGYFESVEKGKSEEQIIKAYEDKLKELESAVEPYDSGGIANGLGFMPKATSQPESVNDPELTRKILTPVSNAEFDRYVKDMGIMFATARQYSQNPIIERVGGNTDNRVDNSRQVFVNGINVGAEKRETILDALALSDIIPD